MPTGKQNEVVVWGADLQSLLEVPNVSIEFSHWKGCDDSCASIDHDPLGKVYNITFPTGTKREKVKENIEDFTLPDSTLVRVVNNGEFYHKVIVFPKKRRKPEPEENIGA